MTIVFSMKNEARPPLWCEHPCTLCQSPSFWQEQAHAGCHAPHHCRERKIRIKALKYLISPPGDQWHGDVSLHPVDTSPWRNKSKDPCNKVNQGCSRVALISACLPQFIQPCAPETQVEHIMIISTFQDLPDDQGGV